MPVLQNQRWELFCQAIAKGETTSKAYETAGFQPSRSNAARLRADERIGRRVFELQEAGANSAEVSVASLLAELEEARSKATSLNQLSAAVRASAEKAKISGLLTQKIEIAVQERDELADASAAEILADVARRVSPDAAIALARAFRLEIRDDGEIIDSDRHVPRSIGNIRLAANSTSVSPKPLEWMSPRKPNRHEI